MRALPQDQFTTRQKQPLTMSVGSGIIDVVGNKQEKIIEKV
jgi:hypothetical protein